MSHKADKGFFEKKRSWSERKDRILGYYLEPYLAKVARLGRPILLVDGFAGPGRFEDGKPGSPLIICQAAAEAIHRGASASVLCIEPVGELHEKLRANLSPFAFAEAKQGRFLDHIPSIESRAATHTIFLYVDPFTVEGLEWAALDRVFRHVHESGSSIEVLMNFNAPSFVRRALAVLRLEVPDIDPQAEDTEEVDAPILESPSAERLNCAVGGTEWQRLIPFTHGFRQQIDAITQSVCDGLRRRFNEAGSLPLKAKDSHRIPKYYLIFATRHSDGLVLMNDAMVKHRVDAEFCIDIFAAEDLKKLVLLQSQAWIQRGELIRRVIRQAFCMYSSSQIRSCVEELLKSGKLKSESGSPRINNAERIIAL